MIAGLLARRPVLLDGAWGTELQARGLALGELPDTWNLTNPDAVADLAAAYVEAGSDVILTNTFRASFIGMRGHPLNARITEINRAGAAIARRAAGGRARVFGSMGPSGKLLIGGEVTERALRSAFVEQAVALAEGGADALVLETMADLVEARIAIEAARSTGLPVVACAVFDSGRRKDRTMMGATPEQAAAALTDAGADVIGANCGGGVEGYVEVCARMRTASDRPIWVKANAGLPVLIEGRPVWPMAAEAFAAFGPALVHAGADFIGGCCGTGPAHVRALAAALRQASCA